MVYQAGGMTLRETRVILIGEVNDVLVCKDTAAENYYTLVVIKDRQCARKMLQVLGEGGEGQSPAISCFSHGEQLCYLFEYRPERRLELFAPGQITSVHTWETAGINLVMECLSSALPYPLLCLALETGNVHIEKDNSIYITPFFDLSLLDTEKDEADCARVCVTTMLDLPLPAGARVKSAKLLRKKLERNACRSLPELYRDFKVTAVSPKKRKLKSRLTGAWADHKDMLFRFLLVLAAAMAIFAVIVLISQLIFGDIPIFRLFEDRFGKIGTRTLS